MASIPVVMLNGTTADADDVMDDFYEIYGNIDSSNLGGTAYTGTALGKFVLQTSGTLITPILTTPAISNPTITGVIANALGLVATPSYTFTGDLNTGIYSPGADQLAVSIGGVQKILFTASSVQIGSIADLYLATTKKLYFNESGTNTSIYENSANDVRIQANSTDAAAFTSSTVQILGARDLYLPTTRKIYFNLTDQKTSIYENSANDVRIQANSTDGFRVTSSLVEVMASRLFYNQDGTAASPAYSFSTDSDTGIYRIGANNIGAAVNGAKVLDIATTGLSITGTGTLSGELILPDIDPPTANYGNRNSLVRAWGKFDSAGATLSSYNSSCAYTGAAATGYTVTWNTDFSSVDYAAVAQVKGVAGFARISATFAGTCTVILYDTTGTPITSDFSIIAIGDQ